MAEGNRISVKGIELVLRVILSSSHIVILNVVKNPLNQAQGKLCEESQGQIQGKLHKESL